MAVSRRDLALLPPPPRTHPDLRVLDGGRPRADEVHRPSLVRFSRRLDSLDILRGAAVGAMVLVNNPATGQPYLFNQMTHVLWNGWHLADVVFPTFLFAVGASLAFSTAKRAVSTSRWAPYLRILRRGVVLFALGLVVNGFSLLATHTADPLGHLRIMGVLQRIAIVYVLAALAVMHLRIRTQVVASAAVLLGYWALIALVPVPGVGHPSMTPLANIPGWLDRTVFGADHMYGAGKLGYDPEGLLGCLPAAVGVLAGYWAARFVRLRRGRMMTTLGLLTAGLVCIGGGQLWSTILPVNKRMWTPSYVVLMTGLCLVALAVLHFLFDCRGAVARGIGKPLALLGANALVAYVGSELTGAALQDWHHAADAVSSAPIAFWMWFRWLMPTFGGTLGALMYGVLILAAWWAVAGFLSSRRIFIRA